MKAAVDAALVTKVATPTIEVTPNDNRFAKFADVTKYMILETYEIGGSNPQFWKGEFTHTPQYAAVQFCEVQQVDAAVRAAATAARVQHPRRHGRVRDPRARPRLVAGAGVRRLLHVPDRFVLGLLCLHWREKDEQERDEAKAKAAAGGRPRTRRVRLAKV